MSGEALRTTWLALSVAMATSLLGCSGIDVPTDVDAGAPPGIENAPVDASAAIDTAIRLEDVVEATRPGPSADAESGAHPDATVVDAHGGSSMNTADVATICGPNGTGAPPGGYTFDTGSQCWAIMYTSAQTGTVPVSPAATMLSFDAVDGQPAPGSLRADIPFSMAGQYVGIGVSLVGTPFDLTGRVVTARIQIVSGLEAPADLMISPAGARIYVKSGPSFVYASGAFTNMTSTGSWITLNYDPRTPGFLDPTAGVPFDPKDIRELGIQIDTSGQTTSAQPAVILIDSVTY